MLVRQFEAGQDLDVVLIVREVERRQKRDGGEFLRVVLGDRTGGVPAMVWDDVPKMAELCVPGTPLHVFGRYDVHAKFGGQITVRALRAAPEGSYDMSLLIDGSPTSLGQMEADLHGLIETVRNIHLRALLDVLLGEGTDSYTAFRSAPAAKRYHQAYAHGLLEHSLTVAQAVSAASATFPGIDRDIAVAGALLHDIGKLEAYTSKPPAFDMTDAGRLQGEIPLGYYRIRRTIEELPGFPPELAEALLHIILSHHGSLEHGSPVVPCTREAMLVHMIDNLGGRLGSFDRLEKELAPGSTWSQFDRAIGTSAYFGLSADAAIAPEGEPSVLRANSADAPLAA